MRSIVKATAAILTATALSVSLAACGSSSGGDSDGPLVVAATPTPHAEILNYVKDKLAKAKGLDLEVKEFTDYVVPNTAVQDGSVDANYFQHKPYLDDFNAEHGTDIVKVPGSDVHLEPLGLYSKKVKSLDALQSKATIAVPNDATNEARALKLLADNKAITLKKGAGQLATIRDIASNPKDFKFKELEAAQLPRTLQDVDAAVINGNYALSAGLKPNKDALVAESVKGNPYTNFVAVKKGNENDPRVKKLVQLLTSPEVKKFITDKYQGAVVPAF